MRRPGSIHLWLVYLGLILLIQFRPELAWADGIPGPLEPLDSTDSRGIEVSRFQLSTPDPFLDPMKANLIAAITLAWDIHRWSMGTTAYVLDWSTQMTWVDSIAGPIRTAADHLRTGFLQPIGLTSLDGSLIGLLLLIAGTVGMWHFSRQQRSRGLMVLVQAVVAACLAVGALSTPVALFAATDKDDSPINQARTAGIQLSTAAVTGEIDASADETPHHGTIIVDTFIRPVHQAINYGAVLDVESPECAKVYDEAIKKAGSADELGKVRDKIGASPACDDKYKEHADNPDASWLVPMLLFSMISNILNLLVWTFIVLQWLAVIMLAWSAIRLLINVPRAILPGGNLTPALRDLVNVAMSLLFVAISLVMLGVVMGAIKTVMGNNAVPLVVRFVGALVVMLAGTVLLILAYVQHMRGSKSALNWMRTKLHQPAAAPSATSRALRWATAPPGQPGNAAGGSAIGGSAAGSGGVGGMINGLRRSRAATAAIKGAKIGAAAVTGGSALAVTAATGAKKAAAKGAIRVGRSAWRGTQNYRAGRAGKAAPYRSRTGTGLAGQVGDTAALAVGRAHSRIKDAAAVVNSGYTGEGTEDRPSHHGDDADAAGLPTSGNAKLDAHLLSFGSRMKISPGGHQYRAKDLRAKAVRNKAAGDKAREVAGKPEPVTAGRYLRDIRRSDQMQRAVSHQLERKRRDELKTQTVQRRSAQRDRIRRLITEGHHEPVVPNRVQRRQEPRQGRADR